MKSKEEPQELSTKYHFNELEYMGKPYYILKTSEIFPYD